MIFKLDASIENTLALTPVIKGWKETTNEQVYLNVLHPELFDGNPYVDGFVVQSMPDQPLLDFNQVEWQSVLKPVCESYLDFAFGKQKPLCWYTIMYNTDEDTLMSCAYVPAPAERVAIVSMVEVPEGLIEYLAGEGYQVVRLTHKDCLTVHIFRATVRRAALYIGDDGVDTAVAMTTDVPAVVCYTWRSPVYFSPFRRGIPFEAISPRKTDCLYADGCMMSNGRFELGWTYGVMCQMKEGMVCQKNVTLERIVGAVERIQAKA